MYQHKLPKFCFISAQLFNISHTSACKCPTSGPHACKLEKQFRLKNLNDQKKATQFSIPFTQPDPFEIKHMNI